MTKGGGAREETRFYQRESEGQRLGDWLYCKIPHQSIMPHQQQCSGQQSWGRLKINPSAPKAGAEPRRYQGHITKPRDRAQEMGMKSRSYAPAARAVASRPGLVGDHDVFATLQSVQNQSTLVCHSKPNWEILRLRLRPR
jgi:hypothetical protein